MISSIGKTQKHKSRNLTNDKDIYYARMTNLGNTSGVFQLNDNNSVTIEVGVRMVHVLFLF